MKRSDLHALDLTQFPATLRWRTVATTGGAPCLSRHSCTAVGSRLVVVGGWNGRIRSPFVHFLDLATAPSASADSLSIPSAPPSPPCELRASPQSSRPPQV